MNGTTQNGGPDVPSGTPWDVWIMDTMGADEPNDWMSSLHLTTVDHNRYCGILIHHICIHINFIYIYIYIY